MANLPEGINVEDIKYHPLQTRVNESVIDGTAGEYYGKYKLAAKDLKPVDIKQYRYHKYSLDYQPLFNWDVYWKGERIIYKWPVYQNTVIEDPQPRMRHAGIYDDTEISKFIKTRGSRKLTYYDGFNLNMYINHNSSYYFPYFSNISRTPVDVDLTNCSLYASSVEQLTDPKTWGADDFAMNVILSSTMGLPIDPLECTLYDAFDDGATNNRIMNNVDGVPYWSIDEPNTTLRDGRGMHIRSRGQHESFQRTFPDPTDGIVVENAKDFGGNGDYLFESSSKSVSSGNISMPASVAPIHGYHVQRQTYYTQIPINCFWVQYKGEIWGNNDVPNPYMFPNVHFLALSKGYKCNILIVARRNGTYGKDDFCSTITGYELYAFTPKSYTDGKKLYNVYKATFDILTLTNSDITSNSYYLPNYVVTPFADSVGDDFSYSSIIRYNRGIVPKDGMYNDMDLHIMDRIEDFYAEEVDIDSKIDYAGFKIPIYKALENAAPYYKKTYHGQYGHIFDSSRPYGETSGYDPIMNYVGNKVFFANYETEYYKVNNDSAHLSDYGPISDFWTDYESKCVLDGTVYQSRFGGNTTWPYYVCPKLTMKDYLEQIVIRTDVIGDIIDNYYDSNEFAYEENTFSADRTKYIGEKEIIRTTVDEEYFITSLTAGIYGMEEPKDFISGEIVYKFKSYEYDDFYASKYLGEEVTYGKPIEQLSKRGDNGPSMGYYYYLEEVKPWDGYIYDTNISQIKYKSQMGSGKLGYGQFISSQIDFTLRPLPKSIIDYFQDDKYIIFQSDSVGEDYYLVTGSEIQSDRTLKVTAVASLDSLQEYSIDTTIDVCRTWPWQYKALSYTFTEGNPAPLPSTPAWVVYWIMNNNWKDNNITDDSFYESPLYKYFDRKTDTYWYIDLETDKYGSGMSPLRVDSSMDNRTVREWITNIAKANLLYPRTMQDHRELCYFDFKVPAYKGRIDTSKVISSSLSKKGYWLEAVLMNKTKNTGFFNAGTSADEEFDKVYYQDNPFMPEYNRQADIRYARPVGGENHITDWMYKTSNTGNYRYPDADAPSIGTDKLAGLYCTFHSGTIKFADIPITEDGYIEVGDVVSIYNSQYLDEEGNPIETSCRFIVTSLETDFKTTTLKCELDVKNEPVTTNSGMVITEN